MNVFSVERIFSFLGFSEIVQNLSACNIAKYCTLKATFHLTISMRGQRATGKIQKNNYHHGSFGTSLTSKTSSVSFIFAQGTHRNVKNR